MEDYEDCIEDLCYTIIETVRTGGFDYMKRDNIYLSVSAEVGKRFEQNIKQDKSCIKLLKDICISKKTGKGLYGYLKNKESYLNNRAKQENEVIIQLDIEYRRYLRLCNVIDKNELDKLSEYEQYMKDKNLPHKEIADFIRSLEQVVNVIPDMYIVWYGESAGLECKGICKYVGEAIFIPENNIEKIVRSCQIAKIY